MLTKGVFVEDYMKLGIREIDVPEPKAKQVMIKTKACGVCCWDSWLYRGVNAPGPYPYPIGHEAVGIVEKVGSEVTDLKPGDKVFCGSGTNQDMSEYTTVERASLCKIPDDTTDYAQYVLEPTCCVTNLLNITDVQLGDHVVLVGAGYMGSITLQALTKASPVGRLTVFEIREDRIKMAKDEFGEDLEIYNPESSEGKQAVEQIINKGGADVVIDFGASDSGFKLADSMTKTIAGKFTIGTFHRGEVTFDGTKWHLSGLNVLNLAPNSNPHFKEVIEPTWEMVKKGVFKPQNYITHTAKFDDLKAMTQMFERSIDKKDNYMKGVVLFD